MQGLASVARLIIAIAVLGSSFSCMVASTTFRFDSTIDSSKLSEIELGVTDLRDLLEWFGPPDCIIDGTQEIYDIQGGLITGKRFPTRTLSAPGGQVILIYYLNLRHEQLFMELSIPVVTADNYQYSVRANELMIFLRKRDHKVLNAFIGRDADERS